MSLHRIGDRLVWARDGSGRAALLTAAGYPPEPAPEPAPPDPGKPWTWPHAFQPLTGGDAAEAG